MHTGTHTHTSILTVQNLIYTQLKTGNKQRFETDELMKRQMKTSAQNGKLSGLEFWEKK